MTTVSIKNVENLLKGKDTFDELKEKFEESGIQVREVKNDNQSDLYLLIANKENDMTPLQKECNGLILEKETNNIVCMCQNKFNTIQDQEQIVKLKSENQYTMEYAEDGTVIRLYNYHDIWYTATTKCIDARKSYWSSEKTFDNMFWDIFQTSNLDNLDKNNTYIFVIIHKENRIVINHKNNHLIYINSINNTTLVEDFTNRFCDNSIYSTIKIDDVSLPFNQEKRGIIIKCLNTENNWDIYQYDFKNYSMIKDIRGNVPLIRMRYLELLNDPEKLLVLEQNYSENYMLFTMIKHCLNNLYKEIHQLYFNSHIKHSIIVSKDHKLYRTLIQLHAIYKKQGLVITLNEVKNKINTLHPDVIKKLLNWV